MLTVWRRTNTSEGYTHIVKVDMTGDGSVHVAAFSIGPRGGAHPGYAGFSAQEWQDINAAITSRRCVDHGSEAERLVPDGDDVNGWGCRQCFMPELKGGS